MRKDSWRLVRPRGPGWEESLSPFLPIFTPSFFSHCFLWTLLLGSALVYIQCQTLIPGLTGYLERFWIFVSFKTYKIYDAHIEWYCKHPLYPPILLKPFLNASQNCCVLCSEIATRPEVVYVISRHMCSQMLCSFTCFNKYIYGVYFSNYFFFGSTMQLGRS